MRLMLLEAAVFQKVRRNLFFLCVTLALGLIFTRVYAGTSADREIQRTLMELLNQMDGFDVLGKV